MRVLTDAVPRLRRALVMAGVGLLTITVLSGCFHGDIQLTVAGDTVSGSVILAYHREVLAATQTSEDQAVSNNVAKLPQGAGVSTQRYTSGNYFGTRSRLDGVSLSALPASSGADPSLLIVHDARAGTYRVSGVMDFTGLTGVSPQLQPLLPEFAMRVAITFPGQVLRHNGVLSGRTVTWRPRVGERVAFDALARDTPPPAATASSAPSSAAAAPETGAPSVTADAPATGGDVPPPAAAPRTSHPVAWATVAKVGGPLLILLTAAGFAVAVALRRRAAAVRPAAAPPPSPPPVSWE